MKSNTISLVNYVRDVLGIQVTIRPWKDQSRLPFFLSAIYSFHEMVVLEHRCLLMLTKKGEEITPATVCKHQEQLQKIWTGPCVYVPHEISAYNRKRLMEHQVSFIVPGSQLYLPDLGMDLREHYRKLRHNPTKPFSPATQAVVIHALMHGTQEHFTPSAIAKTLGYTMMTMTRAFDELEAANIGMMQRKGKERWWQFEGNKRELWDLAKPLMRSPVKKHTWVMHEAPAATAGISALAGYSMLNPPTRPVYAIGIEQWKKWRRDGVVELPSADEASFDLEIWNYNPDLFLSAKQHIVDPFSLYLSLAENSNERVEAALIEMMEKITW